MFSGKTSKLLDLYKQYTFCNMKVAVINHIDDIRYHTTLMSTHDQQMIPCIQTNLLSDLTTSVEVIDSNIVLINEAQFFSDLFTFVETMLQSGKRVYVAGLDGDFKRKRFGQILDLIPICDKVTKLTSLCSQCKNGTPGIFSKRLTDENGQTVIGSTNYIPVCRACYN